MSPAGEPRLPLNHDPVAVRAARELKGWSRLRLAEACGVSPTLSGDIEAVWRNAKPAMLVRLAMALGCAPEALACRPAAVPVGEDLAGEQRLLMALVARYPRVAAGLLAERGDVGLCPLTHAAEVKPARERAGLSIRSLAQTCGVTPTFIREIERGKARVPAGRLGDLAGVVGCPRVERDR
jgi:transcriptional regulator with XRE-family HTH domain